jgi:hypothetical protein
MVSGWLPIDLSRKQHEVLMDVSTTLPGQRGKNYPDGKARQAALIVLGMHRSGTSALTRVLSLLGGRLPRTLMGAHEGNQTGHWESVAIADLNDEILAAAGSIWHDWSPVNSRFAESAEGAQLLQKARTTVREEFGDAPLFVLKDPRICRLMPFWRKTLMAESIDPAIVVPLRSPIEVARSLAARDGFGETEGLLLWLRHVLDAEATTRDLPRIFLTYDQLLADWEGMVERIGDTLGIVWPRLSGLTGVEIQEFLTPDLRHHQVTRGDASRTRMAVPWAGEVYAVLQAWAEGGERAEDRIILDRVRAAFDDVAPVLLRPFLAARQAVARAHEAQALRDVAIVERDAFTRANEEHVGTQSRLQGEYDQLAVRLVALEHERNDLQNEHAALAAKHEALADELRGEKQRSTEIWNEHDRLAAEAQTFNTILAGRDEKLGHLEEALAHRTSEVAELRREQASRITEVIANTPWWWTFMPLAAHKRRLQDMLVRRYPFDAQP